MIKRPEKLQGSKIVYLRDYRRKNQRLRLHARLCGVSDVLQCIGVSENEPHKMEDHGRTENPRPERF